MESIRMFYQLVFMIVLCLWLQCCALVRLQAKLYIQIKQMKYYVFTGMIRSLTIYVSYFCSVPIRFENCINLLLKLKVTSKSEQKFLQKLTLQDNNFKITNYKWQRFNLHLNRTILCKHLNITGLCLYFMWI